MNSFQIRLGERVHNVEILKARQAREWRSQVTLPVEIIQSLLASASTLDLGDPNNISALLGMVSQYVFKSPDLIVDLVMSYCKLPEDVLDSAYDEEFFAAFIEVLKAAYPFGVMSTMFPGLKLGAISKNLLSQNGESGETTSTTKQ